MTETVAADTPIIAKPPSWADITKSFIGDLARPFVLYATGATVGYAIIFREPEVIMAGGAVLSAIYIGKAVETAVVARATAGENNGTNSNQSAQRASRGGIVDPPARGSVPSDTSPRLDSPESIPGMG